MCPRDAKAAVSWARELPNVDARCMYVIGHSIGGGLAALLALHDVPVRFTASVGGMYRAHTFHAWAAGGENQHLVRFDLSDPRECTLRLLSPNIRDLKRPHVTYAGSEDDFDVRYGKHAAEEAARHSAPFEYVEVRGDHMTSMAYAVRDFRRRIEQDLAGCAP